MSRKATSGAPAGSTGDTGAIFIEGASVPVERRDMSIDDIVLDPDNPRIRHAVRQKTNGGTPLTQDQLRDLILEQPGVSDTFKAIRDNGGLIDPIHVRPDGRVIEGNCRAATTMRLHIANRTDPRWRQVPVYLVPKITDRQVAVLQGQFHVVGKNKWRAYEKAGHLHTMHTDLKMSVPAIAKALGIQERVITRLLAAYKTMREKVLPKIKGGRGLDRWSHVEEFYKNKHLEDYRKSDSNVDEFVSLVVDGKIKLGAEVRDLPKILKHQGATKVLKKSGFKEAVATVGKSDPTADSVVFRRVKDLTDALRKLASTELQRVREERKPQQLLRELSRAIDEVAKTAGFEL
jgi:hypothetical protein